MIENITMEVYKDLKVVMINTEDKTNIGLDSKNQHIYFISNSKPVIGDWGIGFSEGVRNNIGRGYYLFYHNGDNVSKLNTLCENSFKVETTTNSSILLPKIPQQFIESYIELYNQNVVINSVKISFNSNNEVIIIGYESNLIMK